MTTRERLLLLAFFTVVLVLLARPEPAAAAVGGVAGAGLGVLVSGRLNRLSRRMDKRLGTPSERPGFSLRRPLVRAGVQLVVLGGLLLSTVLVPFIGDELFAASAAAVTALPTVLTAARLRR